MTRRFVFAAATVAGMTLAAQSQYLPLDEGRKWTLQSSVTRQPIVIEVLDRQGPGYHIRFSSPFGTNEWLLEPRGEKYYLTKFGANGQLADLPGDTLYFDFSARERANWSNLIGKMTVLRREGDRILIQQASKGGKMVFGFEPGKGFVQFGEGSGAFLLSGGVESTNRESSRGSRGSGGARQPAASDNEPVAHVPTPGGSAPSAPADPGPRRRDDGAPRRSAGRVLFSITPNVFANESQSPQNLLKRFDMVTDAGMTFLVHNAKWNELEPKKGQYSLDGLSFNVSTAERLNIPIAYTFRLIETVDRAMPSDLKNERWTDSKLEERLMRVLEEIVPRFKGRVRWFMLGNEIDGYFGRHPNEIGDFAALFGKAKRKIKQLDPSIQVSSTLMYGGIRLLDGAMKPLNDQYDFLCFTYYPIRGDFTMKDPDIVANDVRIMRQYANGRKVLLQEIGYPSGSANQSDEQKQARFVTNVFRELRANGDMIEAGCFWLLADLKDDFVRDLTRFYGITNSNTFRSFLQTLGMFDGQGRPKPAWEVYQQEVRR
jgi:hypothetical protein